MPAWTANNSAYISLVKGKFMHSYTAGLDLQHQELNSELYRIKGDQTKQSALPNSINKLNWQKTRLYTIGNYSYTDEKLTIYLSLPLSINRINYKDDANVLDNSLQKVFFDPNLNLSWQV